MILQFHGGAKGQGFKAYSRPSVDRIWGIFGDLIIQYSKPYCIYLRGTVHYDSE